MDYKSRFKAHKCCIIMPTYNNDQTLEQVITSILPYTDDLIVVNDGATDKTADILDKFQGQIQVLTHEENKGKGTALRNGFKYGRQKGYDYAITIDSDGQHFADDFSSFLNEIDDNPDTLVIGARNMTQENVPGKSSFGNKFSNFWFFVDTGIKLTDTQSGFRLYPIKAMEGARYITTRFEFEVEVIVKAAWRGIKVKNIPIKVHYEPGKKRISHFKPAKDFTRISILNTWFFILALVYYIPKRFLLSLTRENIRKFLKKHLFNKDEPVRIKVFSIGFGVFMGIFPVWGYQMIIGVAISHLLKLNKALFLVASNISLPPFIPFIIFGSYKLGGVFMENPKDDLLFSSGMSFETIKDNLFQYLLGAVILSSVMGALASLVTWLYFLIKGSKEHEKENSLTSH
ncbi:DUF2062 domain-containing protein [Fulvivirga sediminis]|uniref:DUF2062 domain-containing protein n=1 Tax=Fulvivirga sediminis TaxID=2803949 RepID=A0A937K103_9BACT|nr:DUF2062 domain-containing protein [Fulvivirga sediminis]MBL3656830.1 DUF2062 domain-containing protein [Fulvivirga sediminis]